MLENMITTSTTTASHTPTRSRVAAVAASLAVVGALLGMAACSSDDDGSASVVPVAEVSAPPDTKPTPAPPTGPDPVPPTTAAPPQIVAPPTTAAPPSTAAPPTAAVDPHARRNWRDILTEHQAAGEFVGARIAMRDADGTISEANGGTPTLDPASGPVDPDVAWNIGSATKTFVAVVVLQLAEEGRIDLDAGIAGYLPDLRAADRITPRQLLNHTSGLGEYLDQPAVVNDPQRQWTPAELIAVTEAAGRVGEPGGSRTDAPSDYGRCFSVNGWRVIELKYGKQLEAAFRKPYGLKLRALIDEMSNEEYQSLLLQNGEAIRSQLIHFGGRENPTIARLLEDYGSEDVKELLSNLGGHDLERPLAAYAEAFAVEKQPGPHSGVHYQRVGIALRRQSREPCLSAQAGGNRDTPATVQYSCRQRISGFPADSEEAQYIREKLEEGGWTDGQGTGSANPPITIPAALGGTYQGMLSTQAALGRIFLALSRDPQVAPYLVTASLMWRRPRIWEGGFIKWECTRAVR